MGVPLDITGEVFGRLTAVAPVRKVPPGEWIWQLTCACGGTKEARVAQLRAGKAKSCGCLAREAHRRLGKRPRREHPSLAGQVFSGGQITVLGLATPVGKRRPWRCLCRCGETFEALRNALTAGRVKSCGCLASAPRTPSLAGQVFRHLTVLRRAVLGDAPRFPAGLAAYYVCRCVCGTEVVTTRDRLLRGQKQSCGCMHNVRAPGLEVDTQHGRLTVKGLVRDGIKGSRLYRCLCLCGVTCVRTDEAIETGSSCGCGRKKAGPRILHTIFGEKVSTADLALIAGMKTNTLYARVQRGVDPTLAAFGLHARAFPTTPPASGAVGARAGRRRSSR